jgi:hypothetical protein
MLKAIIITGAAIVALAGVAEAKGGGGGGRSSSSSSGGSHAIRGHVTKNGTYVAPARATNPNATKTDNWTTAPNVNPYTGQAGTKSPY